MPLYYAQQTIILRIREPLNKSSAAYVAGLLPHPFSTKIGKYTKYSRNFGTFG